MLVAAGDTHLQYLSGLELFNEADAGNHLPTTRTVGTSLAGVVYGCFCRLVISAAMAFHRGLVINGTALS